MNAPHRGPLPVTVLTGFLGSGKTTLVNRLLKERPGTRFGMVVNEFGEASLESQLVENRNRPIHELPSGCLCCVSEGDLKGALDALVKKDPKVAHILVEASGLSSPGPLLGVLTQDDGDYRLGGVFCLADASTFVGREQEFPTLRRQLAFADTVLLTKTDLVTAEAKAAVVARLTDLKPGVRVLDTAGKLPWSALFETDAPAAGGPGAGTAAPTAAKRRFFQGGSHHDVDVLEYQSDDALDVVKLNAVFAALDPAILRAKGVVYLDDRSAKKYKYLVQYTGAQKQLYSRRWAPGEARQTTLVFLGSGFDAAGLKARLDGCRATAEGAAS
jgi:G3E family GTPase